MTDVVHTAPVLLSTHVLLRGGALVVLDGGRRHVLDDARTVVGSGETAALRLDDPTVSRFHCEIVLGAGEAVVRDLGSVNGTFVNGVRVEEAVLEPGQTLTLGRTRLGVESEAAPVKLELLRSDRFGRMVGVSAAIRRVFQQLDRAAASDATVLLEGETGTGKELAARSLHEQSPRARGPFVVVDCGAMPPNLLESELLGHERGAFTGAVSAREGAFEAADGGTLFLDEIGELPLDLQPKLLRVLERREIKRLGGNQVRPIDVRVVAATNRDLKLEVNERRFRADLFYRLAVVPVRLPPLRERPEDLPMLVEDSLERLGAGARPEAERLRSPEMRAELARHDWPGNARELRNWVERCVALRAGVSPAGDDEGEAAAPEPDLEELLALPLRDARVRWTETFERRYLRDLLAGHGGNVAAAARAAGVNRAYLYRLLAGHGMTRGGRG